MRDRSRLVSIEVSKKAKEIYDAQQHKGEFVSDAIIEKHSRDTDTSLEQRIENLEKKVKHIESVLEKEGKG